MTTTTKPNDLPLPNYINWDRLITLLAEPRGNLTNTLSFMTKWFKAWTTLSPTRDIHGNFWLTIGDNPTTLFISHTDTVDPEAETMKKALTWEPVLGLLGVDKGAACLGADDGAGVEALVCMAEAGVPGLYLWAANEERGASGSRGFLRTMGNLLKDIRLVISFDRRGTTEVITKQWSGDCASVECGQALADMLKGVNNLFTLGVGSFTDSSLFADQVSECLNLSVGYLKEHTPQETLNLHYLDKLVGRLLTIPWGKLPIVRTPGDYGWFSPKVTTIGDDLLDMVYSHPEEVADFIEILDLEVDLRAYLSSTTTTATEETEDYSTYGDYNMPQVWPGD